MTRQHGYFARQRCSHLRSVQRWSSSVSLCIRTSLLTYYSIRSVHAFGMNSASILPSRLYPHNIICCSAIWCKNCFSTHSLRRDRSLWPLCTYLLQRGIWYRSTLYIDGSNGSDATADNVYNWIRDFLIDASIIINCNLQISALTCP